MLQAAQRHYCERVISKESVERRVHYLKEKKAPLMKFNLISRKALNNKNYLFHMKARSAIRNEGLNPHDSRN